MNPKRIGRRTLAFCTQLDGWFLNHYVIEGLRQNYVIDTGLGAASMAPVLSYLAGGSQPTVVVNTHHHWDHVWGNHCFPGCPIVAHKQTRALMDAHWGDMLKQNGAYQKGAVACRLPDWIFSNEFSFPEDGLLLFHSPGHTLDSISIFDEQERFLHLGDNLGEGEDDLLPSLETDPETFAQTIAAYQSLPASLILSGHNVPQEPQALAAMRDLLPG